MAGMKGSKIRRVARIIRLPCGGSCGGSFSPKQANDNNILKRSSIVSAKSNTENQESTTKTLCPICLEQLNYNTGTKTSREAIFTAQCSHSFHFTCISSNVRHGNVTCPICRAYWSQLPRDLYISHPSTQTTDPILRILDDSIETFRVHRQSSLGGGVVSWV
ncbi:hypothetical protein ACHQM5_021272 [Ranunculus cassubicifolius]